MRKQNRKQFFLVFVLVACAFLFLMWVSGHKPQEKDRPRTKVSGLVAHAPSEIRDALLSVALSSDGESLIRVPTHLVKKGVRGTLDDHQRENFQILAAFFARDPRMLKVAACEAMLRHVDVQGQVLAATPVGSTRFWIKANKCWLKTSCCSANG